MTGITVMNNARVDFTGTNLIQNNRANKGAGIKLHPNAIIFISDCLRVHNNIAYHSVGAGIYRINY